MLTKEYILHFKLKMSQRVHLFHFSQLCEDLFTKINEGNTDNSMSYSVEVSASFDISGS